MVFHAYQNRREALAEIDTLHRQNRELQKKLDGLMRRNNELEVEAAQRTEAHETAQHVTALLQDQNHELQEALEAQARRNFQLEERNNQLENTEQILHQRVAEKENSLQAAGGMLHQLYAERRALSENTERLRTRISGNRDQNTQNQDRIAQLETELRRAMEDLHHTHTSRSYRITRPLRRIRAIFSNSHLA
jgi:chromosome segregation ATPase